MRNETQVLGTQTGALEETIFNGTITARVFGRFYHGVEVDWTFRDLNKPSDAANESDIVRLLPEVARSLRVQRILAPKPIEQNGRVALRSELTTSIKLGGIEVLRGALADGCLIEPGEAFAISVGGCAVLLAWRNDGNPRVVAVHAGRDSVVPPSEQASHQGSPISAARALGLTRDTAHLLRGRVILPIDPEIFDHPENHPEYGHVNRQRTSRLIRDYGTSVISGDQRDGCINLAELIRRQLEWFGVPPEHISVGASTAAFPGRVYTTRETDPQVRSRRNLVIIARQT